MCAVMSDKDEREVADERSDSLPKHFQTTPYRMKQIG